MSAPAEHTAAFPNMDYESWRHTLETIHRFAQVVGKLRLAASPWHNQWWNVPLRLTGRGLTTRPMGRDPIFCIDFDFLDHRVDLTITVGSLFTGSDQLRLLVRR